MIQKNIYYILFFSLVILGCGRLDTIEYSPKLSPEAFLSSQHWIRLEFLGLKFVLSQPSSSLIVYFVSFFTIFVGYQFFAQRENHKSKLWWGIGLFLTGAGAVLAGTSYQAFGYELKCVGRETCKWTNWWEIIYALLSGLGMNAFLVACAHSNATGNFKKWITNYAIVNSILYSTLLLYGAFVPIQFLVSFEFLSLSSTPSVIFFIWIYGKAYKQDKSNMNLYLRNTWIILILVIFSYAIYMILGFTQTLWSKGIWFSDNDVLHVGMIYWIYYISTKLPSEVKDFTN
ncbi:MAG: hypothetical protein SFU98_01965 [Leptospiraceae bacterium]|nr:hypothetical protein [Leptospiraceae bacterium]